MKWFIVWCFLCFVIYSIGAVIAWDLNPANWWIIGRIIAIFFAIVFGYTASEKATK